MNIEKKTVLVTGGNRGIGRALVDEALRRGAKRVYGGTRVALHNIDERVTAVTLDVTNAAQIQAAVEKVDELRCPHQQCRRRHLRRSEQARCHRTAPGGKLPRSAHGHSTLFAAAEKL